MKYLCETNELAIGYGKRPCFRIASGAAGADPDPHRAPTARANPPSSKLAGQLAPRAGLSFWTAEPADYRPSPGPEAGPDGCPTPAGWS